MMSREEAMLQHFDRFYNSVLKDKLRDPKVDSEWAWFLTRLRDPNFKTLQVDQYLDGLERSRRLSENTLKPIGQSPSNHSKIELRFGNQDKDPTNRNRIAQKEELTGSINSLNQSNTPKPGLFVVCVNSNNAQSRFERRVSDKPELQIRNSNKENSVSSCKSAMQALLKVFE